MGEGEGGGREEEDGVEGMVFRVVVVWAVELLRAAEHIQPGRRTVSMSLLLMRLGHDEVEMVERRWVASRRCGYGWGIERYGPFEKREGFRLFVVLG